MNKFKKVAVAAVSVVMAGTMAFSFAACDKDDGIDELPASKTLSDLTAIKQKAWKNLAGWYNGETKYSKEKDQLEPNVDGAGRLTYTAGTEIAISIGYNNAKTGTRYNSDLANTVDSGVKIAGYDVKENGFKPAWQGLQKALGVTFKDEYTGSAAGKNISDMKSGVGLNKVGILTASGNTITTESASGAFLNVAAYLDYMPNYKAFLQQNEVVWASLIADASTGAMYMLPYFDGNNDIEKYVLMRKDIVEKLLDATDVSAATTTFKAQADAKAGSSTAVPKAAVDGSKATVESFMGKTGHYDIPLGDMSIRVDYDAAKTAANSSTSELGKAVRAAYSGVGTLESGNIVDIQNAVINGTSGAVTGAQLLKITQEYIKVAYKANVSDEDTFVQFYGVTLGSGNNAVQLKLSDVFNSFYAAWDADLYTALGRCYVTSTALLGDLNKGVESTYLVTGRARTSQRESDLYSLAGELYGARGLESRNNFAYIDQDGNIKDAREDEASWNAVAKLHALAVEGLLDTTTNTPQSYNKEGADTQTLSMHDYVQTQTAQGFSKKIADYNFAPILTPVSNWDVDGDGTKETVMRFTESWRGVKDGGLAVSKSYIGNDKNKLSAILAFIDYCYSNDGQIMMTYGAPSSTDTDGALTLDGDNKKVTANTFANDGMWYNEEVTSEGSLEQMYSHGIIDTYDGVQYFVKGNAKSRYFMFGNKLYEGTPYLGRSIPTMTKENLELFKCKAIGNKSFTGYARQYLGTTLPCFNKDQGFEFQCTSECGKEGASIVSEAIVLGLIKHQFQTLDCTDGEGNLMTKVRGFGPSMWYTQVPTTLPFDNDVKTALSTGAYRWLTGNGGDSEYYFCVSSSVHANAYISVIKYGFDSSREVTSGGITLGSSAADMIAKLQAISQ